MAIRPTIHIQAPRYAAKWSPLVFKRLFLPVYLLLASFVLGTAGYYAIGAYAFMAGVIEKPWTLLNCAFMTAISLTTVGYGDYVSLEAMPLVKIYTMMLLFAGMGVVTFGVSEATSFFVEGHLKKLIERRNMMKAMDALNGHIVLCGLGTTGGATFQELVAIGEPFVAIDEDRELVEKLNEQHPNALIIAGDAGDEEILKMAGTERARGIIACLSDDRDNVVLTISARCLNPQIKIVARAKNASTAHKLRAAGAENVVTPTITGGLRLASEMVRPNVTTFLDTMLRSGHSVRFGEVDVPVGSELVGKKLSQSGLKKETGLQIIALRTPAGEISYNDEVDRVLAPGDVLIAIGTVQQLDGLKAFCRPTV